MAYIDYQASLCVGCGQSKAESTDRENHLVYEAVPVQCFACAARDAESRQASQSTASGNLSKSALDGLYIGVQRRGGD